MNQITFQAKARFAIIEELTCDTHQHSARRPSRIIIHRLRNFAKKRARERANKYVKSFL